MANESIDFSILKQLIPNEILISSDWTLMKVIMAAASIGSLCCMDFCASRLLDQYQQRLIRFDIFTTNFWMYMSHCFQAVAFIMKDESYQIAASMVSTACFISSSTTLFINTCSMVCPYQLMFLNQNYMKYVIALWPIIPAICQVYYWENLTFALASWNLITIIIASALIIFEAPGTRTKKFSSLIFISLSSSCVCFDFFFKDDPNTIFFICKLLKCSSGLLFYIYFKLVLDTQFLRPNNINLLPWNITDSELTLGCMMFISLSFLGLKLLYGIGMLIE